MAAGQMLAAAAVAAAAGTAMVASWNWGCVHDGGGGGELKLVLRMRRL